MFLLVCICVVISSVVGSPTERPHYDLEQAEQLFEDFIKTHGKIYSGQEEKEMRLEIFKDSLKRINERNSVGNAIFVINHFSDLIEEEHHQYMGFIFNKEEKSECEILTDKDITTKDAPTSFDWLSRGAVTAVKDQGQCGACWAFACVGNIEGQYFLKTKQLLSFSEQELVDCSKNNHGCYGGYMATALTDLKHLGGVQQESSYPYEATNGRCRFNSSRVVAKLVSCKKYKLKDEEILKQLLVTKGPLIIGINGNRVMEYHKGILSKADCEDSIFLGHAVLLVGYGTQDGSDYWLIKNSWGTAWGENGYFRMSRGDNTCELMGSRKRVSYIASADL